MELLIIAICLVAAGWFVWKTGWAIKTLRAQRRHAEAPGSGGGQDSGSSGSIAGLGGESISGHHGGVHGDCGGHGHGGGDSGGHGGW